MNKKDKKGIIICIVCIIILTLIIIVCETVRYIKNYNWVNYLLNNSSDNYWLENANGTRSKIPEREIEEILNKYKDSSFEATEICYDEWKEYAYPRLTMPMKTPTKWTEIGKNYLLTNDSKLEKKLNVTEKKNKELTCERKIKIYIPSFDITEELEKYSN